MHSHGSRESLTFVSHNRHVLVFTGRYTDLVNAERTSLAVHSYSAKGKWHEKPTGLCDTFPFLAPDNPDFAVRQGLTTMHDS